MIIWVFSKFKHC